ncbi:30S ribosomal protein S6 [Gottschalkia acidurici 9a]|uniref:Small ribosomal subunit protein bS6 n=1 Tax=Gottschalkia acidurici (strain ATCC 7906 / DSM 604 / BCRC 14475 / CIP 104303 / KCTC 5404 / NCIMB 10678 / 9a) TaxID=1128398 RepID=K0B5S5_GOTA9|nr:30S ribosomal protein S6 [Gottschalkia acidurici]AFS79846.1 30S ribosomal protein S6 [Gottschalkia acidurici 9a]
MRKYEAVFIFAPSVDEERRNGLIERFKGIIETNGSLLSIDEWGSRKLAYEIDDLTEGYYILLNIEAGSDVIDEIDRVTRITDGIIRHMIVREDEK